MSPGSRPGLRSLLALCACSAANVLAQDATPSGDLDVVLSHEHSRGGYGERTRTTIDQTTLTLRYRRERWLWEVQVPRLRVADPASAGLPETFGAGRPVETDIGDIWLKVGYELVPAAQGTTGIDLGAKLKTKTGDPQRGLGTGGIDEALQVEFTRPFRSWTSFGHVGWRNTGDVAGFTPYKNPWYAEFGAFTPLTKSVEAGGFADVRQRIGRLGPVRELTLYTSVKSGDWRMQFYLTRGFATASPDLALGVSLRRRY